MKTVRTGARPAALGAGIPLAIAQRLECDGFSIAFGVAFK